MSSPEFEHRDNVLEPDLQLIKDLQQKMFIKDGSPLWWSTDFEIDPREFIPFDEFRRRLVKLGKCPTKKRIFRVDEEIVTRDLHLYPGPNVPISILNLEVDGNSLPLLITARPYNKKEILSQPFSRFLREHPLGVLPEYVQNGGIVDLPNHFYPHIRGLFAGKRGEHFFFNLTHATSWWEEFGLPIKNALDEKGLGFIEFYDAPMFGDRTYTEVWDEVGKKPELVDRKTPKWVNFESKEVSAEEFIANYQKTDEDLVVFYPLRVADFKNTLPLVIATKTHKESTLKSPVVLGIYAENGLCGRCRRGGILRIKDRQLASTISKAITDDFRIEVDTILFTPQKGKPKYERV